VPRQSVAAKEEETVESKEIPFGMLISRRESLRWGLAGAGSVLASGVLTACGGSSDSSQHTTTIASGKLHRFDPNAPAGSVPKLPKVLGVPGAYDIPESEALVRQMQIAAATRGMTLQSAVANGDIAKTVDQTQQMFARGIGALFMYPLNEHGTRFLAQQALDKGICVVGVERPYCTLQTVEDKHAGGVVVGSAAAKWIREHAGGKAKVVLFDESKLNPATVPYFKAIRAELKKVGPEVEIVETDERGSAEQDANAFSALLQAHPDINVVHGNALSAIAAASVFEAKGGGSSADVYISVLAGGDDALAKVESGNSVIKAVFGIPWPVMSYGIGLMAGDWLQGKSIPRVITVRGGAVEISSPDAVPSWRNDMKNAGDAWNQRRDTYVELWGNINYDQRDNYWRELVVSPANAKA
jgi:ABC-type sugar transport system substrate-binding protein